MLKFIKEHWKFTIYEIVVLGCLIYYTYWTSLQPPLGVTGGFNFLSVIPLIIISFLLFPMFCIMVD